MRTDAPSDAPLWTMYPVDLHEHSAEDLAAYLRAYPHTRFAESVRHAARDHGEYITLGAFMDTDAVCAWTPSDVHAGDDMRVVTGWEGAQS